MKHTKGSWEVLKHATPEWSPQFGVYAEGSQNAHCIVRYDNAEANARLIAAAPDLLEACKALVINAVWSGEGKERGDNEYLVQEKIIEMARNAISKTI